MKKNMFKVAFVVAIALVCGINVFNAQKSEALSEIALANVEALSDKTPSGDTVCRWDASYEKCVPEGTQQACPCGSHNW